MKPIQTILLLTYFLLMSCSKETVKQLNDTETIAVKLYDTQKSVYSSDIESSGFITTENETRLAFKIGGVIDKILVKEGQSFRKGQLLATLKQTEIESQVAQAQLSLEKNKRDYFRIKNLYKDSVASLEQLQNTKTGLDVSAKLLELASFNKRYAYIYAENNGFVIKKLANEGEVIQGGFPVLTTNVINNQKNWIVRIGVSEKEWEDIQENSKCTVESNGKQYIGVVSQKSQALDLNSGTFQVEIKLLNAPSNLAVGMFAKVKINNTNTNLVNTIPYDALIEANGKNAFVFIPSRNSSVKRIPIVIKSFNEKQVVVEKGLENVSKIIVGNSPFLSEKSKIRIIK